MEDYIPVAFTTVAVRSSHADAVVRGGARVLVHDLKGLESGGLIRWICMSGGDVRLILSRLARRGIGAGPRGSSPDVAIIDMHLGPLGNWRWLDTAIWSDGRFRMRLNPLAVEARTTPVQLLAWISGEGWVCPMPIPWNDLWKLLNYGEPERAPQPLILANWSTTSKEQKTERLREQFEWADQRGRLGAVAAFLRRLEVRLWATPEDF